MRLTLKLTCDISSLRLWVLIQHIHYLPQINGLDKVHVSAPLFSKTTVTNCSIVNDCFPIISTRKGEEKSLSHMAPKIDCDATEVVSSPKLTWKRIWKKLESFILMFLNIPRRVFCCSADLVMPWVRKESQLVLNLKIWLWFYEGVKSKLFDKLFSGVAAALVFGVLKWGQNVLAHFGVRVEWVRTREKEERPVLTTILEEEKEFLRKLINDRDKKIEKLSEIADEKEKKIQGLTAVVEDLERTIKKLTVKKDMGDLTSSSCPGGDNEKAKGDLTSASPSESEADDVHGPGVDKEKEKENLTM
ncbi:unnamed protein product [Urochloa humidicola]